MLQNFRCLQSVPGVALLLGIVMNEDNDMASGFLCELPTGDRIFNVITSAEKWGTPITWN